MARATFRRVDGQDTVLALGQISMALARGLEPYTGEITGVVRRMFDKIFASRGGYAGTPWAPSAAATVFRKLMAGYGATPMVRTGTLWASLTQEGAHGLTVRGRASARQFGYAVLSPDRTQLRIGSTDPVLRLSEKGTRHQPGRPVFPKEIPPKEQIDILNAVIRGLGF